jgi:anti-anti-sigma regulatory factor
MQTPYKIVAEAHAADCSVTLLLNGKFGEDAIQELDDNILAASRVHQHIYIDLSEVTLIDRKAVEYFSGRAGQNVTLVNCPVYLRRWISRVSDEVEK